MRGPTPRMYTERCKQFRPTVGKDDRGGTTNTPVRVLDTGESESAGFLCSFKFVGVRNADQGGADQPVQEYSLLCPARSLYPQDLIQCPGKFPGLYFKVESVGRPSGGTRAGTSTGTGGFLTATCTLYQPAAAVADA